MKQLRPVFVALFVFSFAGLASALGSRQQPSRSVAVQGRVLTQDGSPAAGAVVVSSAGGQTVTQTDGTFQLEFQQPHVGDAVHVTALASDSKQVGTARVSGSLSGTARLDTIAMQQSHSCPPSWLPTFGGEPGTNREIRALAVFDDGSGAGPALYLGGSFTSAEGIFANSIVKWDGSSWSTLGSGLSAGFVTSVEALEVFDDGGGPALYAGGNFTLAGGQPANSIARWDGSSWSTLGSGATGGAALATVRALTVFDDGNGSGPALYAGGNFAQAGGVAVNHVAKWDGSSWTALASGLLGGIGSRPGAYALTVFDDGSGGGPALFAAGDFTTAGAIPADNVAKWDGTVWSGLGSGTNGVGHALTVFDDGGGAGQALYVGGNFTNAGGVAANSIAKWDGSVWSALGSGLTGGAFFSDASALTVFDDGTAGGPALYAKGNFKFAGGVSAASIARWDGAGWSALAGGLAEQGVFPDSHALAVFDDGSGPALYAGGGFKSAGGVIANHIAKWDAASWAAVGGGKNRLNGTVFDLAVFDDGGGPALHAGGRYTSAGGVAVGNVARWDGTSWSTLGGAGNGTNAAVFAMTVFDDGNGPALYVGGEFTSAGGSPAGRIAKWDGSSWSQLGAGMNSFVLGMTVFDDGSGAGPALYAGGTFTSAGGVAANHIAKWDGSNWSPLGGVGSGTSASVITMRVFDDGSGGGDALYAGGTFASAGGVAASRIARWNGSSWSALGAGLNGAVFALTAFDDGGGPLLYAGGDFTSSGGTPVGYVAKWNGAAWSGLGTGLNDAVEALAVFDDGCGGAATLCAGGSFTNAGGVATRYVARWSGSSWSTFGPVGSGMNARILSMVSFDDGGGGGPALFAGGIFTISPSGDSYLAKWGRLPEPFTTFCSPKTALVCGPILIGATGSPSATATSGFTVEAQPVRGCRAGLLLYSDQPSVTGVPFGGPGDGFLCLSPLGLRRAGPIQSSSLPSACNGILTIDMNRFATSNWSATGCNPPPGQNNPAGFLGNMGTTVNAQMWGRDSISTGQVLSDGIGWTVAP